MYGKAWNALFWCNHDQPRIVSRFGNEEQWHQESAKMLAMLLHGLQGTPYIYQGEEFGMTNPNFTTIEQYRDVESLNAYAELQEKGIDETLIMQILAQSLVIIAEHQCSGMTRHKLDLQQVSLGLMWQKTI